MIEAEEPGKLRFLYDEEEVLTFTERGMGTPPLHIVSAGGAMGITTPVPKTPIHIMIGADEYTDEDIRQWAKGNTENLGGIIGQESLVIVYLSQIIVNQVLEAPCE